MTCCFHKFDFSFYNSYASGAAACRGRGPGNASCAPRGLAQAASRTEEYCPGPRPRKTALYSPPTPSRTRPSGRAGCRPRPRRAATARQALLPGPGPWPDGRRDRGDVCRGTPARRTARTSIGFGAWPRAEAERCFGGGCVPGPRPRQRAMYMPRGLAQAASRTEQCFPGPRLRKAALYSSIGPRARPSGRAGCLSRPSDEKKMHSWF